MVKKFFIIFLIEFSIFNFIFSQLIKKPATERIDIISTNKISSIIEEVKITEDNTIVTLELSKNAFSGLDHPYIIFSRFIYLIDTKDTLKKFKILDIKGAQFHTKLYLTSEKKYYVKLYFPKITYDVRKINIVDEFFFNKWLGIKLYDYDLFESNFCYNTKWKEEIIKKYWEQNGLDPIEGIYEIIGKNWKYALFKFNNNYYLINLSYSKNLFWLDGDLKAYLYPTASPYVFKSKMFSTEKNLLDNILIKIESNLMKIYNANNLLNLDELSLLKIYPTATFNRNVISTGTGFALTSNGIIATCNHIIENAKKIRVKGIDLDFSKSYNAEVLLIDRNNDLALIKIIDDNFNNLPQIPFKIKNDLAQVGEEVFVLGYPLTDIMGNEIKLTTGVISAKTGFQNDVTVFQISAPVQPGNSGGPVFNKKGELVGIVNAKLMSGENVSYALKSIYLTNLLLSSEIELNQKNLLENNDLISQVEILKKFVFIIEVEK